MTNVEPEIALRLAPRSGTRVLRRAWSLAKRPLTIISRKVKRRLLGTITGVETEDRVAALTFDDGPDSEFTPRLLEILERHQARATFFMVGEAAGKQPELVRQVAQAGHAIGNHTWDHRSLPSLSWSERREQIRGWERGTGSYGQHLLRPPYGHQNAASRVDALLLGYQVITWNLAIKDWEDHTAEWMAARVIREIKPGSIVLFHDTIYCDWPEDGPPQYDRSEMLMAIEMILENLKGQYRFITVPELLTHGRPILRYWTVEKSEDWKSLSYRW